MDRWSQLTFSNRRIARHGGVKHIQITIYDTMREVLIARLRKVTLLHIISPAGLTINS
jgi:hypothetical protein